MNIYILKYNNYYNRVVKRFDSFEEYEDYIYYPLYNTNFNPNDGISANITVGSGAEMYDGLGDYILITENNEIISRWFILEAVRSRGGQFYLTLRRDVVADYFNTIIDSPIFIEKANLQSNDILVFNSEDFSVNQIKKNERYIKDNTGCAWIIGYYAKNATDINGTVKVNENNVHIDIQVPIENWEYYGYNNDNPLKAGIVNGEYYLRAKEYPTSLAVEFISNLNNGETSLTTLPLGSGTSLSYYIPYERVQSALYNSINNFGLNTLKNHALTYFEEIKSDLELEEAIDRFNGKTIIDANGKVFRVTITNAIESEIYIRKSIASGSLFEDFKTIIQNTTFGYNNTKVFGNTTMNEHSFACGITTSQYIVELEEIKSEAVTYDITANESRETTVDAPWNIFAIPFGEITVKNTVGETIVLTNKEIAINTAMAIQAQHPNKVYDMQLVPFFPYQELIEELKTIKVSHSTQYSLIKKQEENFGIIFNIPRSVFTFDVFSGYAASNTAIEKKLNDTCNKYRLTSPNYSNYFEFSVEKNGGIKYFNIDCEYKPFTPYIHINPNFGNLYGQDFNDVRGLILGGDFSLSQIINQWEQYQIQNKNFQQIFDRQIQNMEVQNKYARIREAFEIGAGTIAGATGGAMTGTMLAPGIGSAAAGAIIGGGASLIGGIADYKINEALRQETLDYTKDLFGYNLGNIQALPNTIGKVSSYNPNNKVFPIIEFYTCTDREKRAFINKIAYNGMTVMAIGTISEYIGNSWEHLGIKSRNYIKGKLIRIESIDEDYHITNVIAEEINKGAYFE